VPQPSDLLLQAVRELSAKSGHDFQSSMEVVPNTSLFVVHAKEHEFRAEYTVSSGVLGFRVPSNYPDASPEDSFFIVPVDVKLRQPDAVRQSVDLNRAGRAEGLVVGSALGNAPVLLFSWHLWDRSPWDRRKHTLFDHYTHCIRRFELPEHD